MDDEIFIDNSQQSMEPPKLVIDDEDFKSGVNEIGQTNEDSYSPEALQKISDDASNLNNRNNKDFLNIEIPSSEQPIEEVLPSGIPQTTAIESIGEKGESVVPKKVKKKKIKISIKSMGKKNIMSMVIYIVIFIAGILVGKSVLSNNNTNYGIFNAANNIPLVEDNNNYFVYSNGFNFKVPKSYTFDKSNNGVIVYAKDKFRLYIKPVKANYETIASAKKSIGETLKFNGTTVNKMRETIINEERYVIIDTITNMQNRQIVITKAGEDYIFFAEIINKEKNVEKASLNALIDIMKHTTFDGETSEIETLGVNDVSEIIIRTSDAYKNISN